MSGIFIGYDQDGMPLTYKKDGASSGEGHLFLSAPPRTGKARDILIPALLQYDEGSCVVIDPKGQLAAVTAAERRRMGQRVIVLNPFDILPHELGGMSARFNPMATLDPNAATFGADCDNIADSIVTHEGGDHQNHWSDSARGLVAGLIGHLSANMNHKKTKTLTMVRRAITSPTLLRNIAQDAQGGSDDFVAESLNTFADDDPKNKGEIASIISTANTQTRFLGNRAIAESVAGSDFSFAELKNQPTTVYLVLPVKYLKTCGKWFRLVLAAALDELLNENKGLPVLCILDEFAQLGKLAVIEDTLGLAAGLGVQLWPVLQDLTQLKDLYPNRWESFLGCAGVQMFFAPRENTTATYLSELCGDTTIEVTSQTTGSAEKPGLFWNETTGFNNGTSTHPTKVPAFSPQEIRRMSGNECLMFWDGLPGRFIKAYRQPYWESPELRGLYSPDPYHKRHHKPDQEPQPPQVVRAPARLGSGQRLIGPGGPSIFRLLT
jgi:type IV secretion system protein VirD4